MSNPHLAIGGEALSVSATIGGDDRIQDLNVVLGTEGICDGAEREHGRLEGSATHAEEWAVNPLVRPMISNER